MSYFQEEPSGFDRKDSSKDALQGRTKVERTSREPKEAGARRHAHAWCCMPVLQWSKPRMGSMATTHGRALGPAVVYIKYFGPFPWGSNSFPQFL